MKKLYLLLLLLIPYKSFSTTIIIVIDNNVITIGADSKLVLFVTEVKDGKAVFSTKTSSVCKISKINDFICTGAGVNIETILKYSPVFLNPNLPISSQLNALCAYLIPKLTPEIELERRQNRTSYIKHFKKGYQKDYFATFCFCSFENGKAIVYTLEFGCVNNENQKVNIHSRVKKYIGEQDLQLGHTDVIHQLIVSGEGFRNKSIPKAMYDLIEMEIKDAPDFVGKPINVIEITGQGKYNWVYNDNCKF
jgi:hypothetical protein